MRGQWKKVIVVMAVAAAVVSFVAIAVGSTQAHASRTAASGSCNALMIGPQALKATRDLRAEHRREMQAWYEQYGSDPSSAAARGALRRLREEHQRDMRELLEGLGIDVPSGVRAGGMMDGAGGCGSIRGAGRSQATGFRMSGGMMHGWN